MEKKEVIFSGIQPSGILTLGNYIGAIRNWEKLQDNYDCFYCVVDMHAITVKQETATFRRRGSEMFALLLACGLDPERNTIFVQSHVPAHAELGWVLNCNIYMGELSRMTQFKEKSQKHSQNINAGLFCYPALMAADILLYNTNLVPIGADQKQHLELTRDVATRFNSAYGDVFTIPEPYIPKVGARVMSLADPAKKMSKSDENPNAYISILDKPDVIVSKIKRAVTDSDTVNPVRIAEDKPGVGNLIGIYSALTEKAPEKAVQEFEGKGYGEFKAAVAESVVEAFKPIQDKYEGLVSDKQRLSALMEQGAEKAERVAGKTLAKVYKKIGFVARGR